MTIKLSKLEPSIKSGNKKSLKEYDENELKVSDAIETVKKVLKDQKPNEILKKALSLLLKEPGWKPEGDFLSAYSSFSYKLPSVFNERTMSTAYFLVKAQFSKRGLMITINQEDTQPFRIIQN